MPGRIVWWQSRVTASVAFVFQGQEAMEDVTQSKAVALDAPLVRRLFELNHRSQASAAVLAYATECAVMLHDLTGSGSRSHLGGRSRGQAIHASADGSPLSLLAEIHLDEVPDFQGRQVLPGKGVFEIWYDAMRMPCNGSDGVKVIYHSDQDLHDFLPAASKEDQSEGKIFAHTPIRFQPRISLMGFDHLMQEGVDVAAGLEFEPFSDFVDSLRLAGIEMVTGEIVPVYSPGFATEEAQGHATFAADIPHQLLGQMATLQEEARIPGSRLLLQFDSDLAGPGWIWGDGGVLWLHIPEDALLERRFDEVTCTWSSC